MRRDRVLEILRSLAEGVHPLTGRRLPSTGPLHSPEVIRALFSAISLLEASNSGPSQPPAAKPSVARRPLTTSAGTESKKTRQTSKRTPSKESPVSRERTKLKRKMRKSYPTRYELEIPLLAFVESSGGSLRFSQKGDELEATLANQFRLTRAQREFTSPDIQSKGHRLWRNHIQFARWHLVNLGYLDNSRHDTWCITEEGRNRLRSEA